VSSPEIPPALANVSLDRIEELEQETGQSFGALIAEIASGEWSVATMRRLLALVDPERKVETMGDLVAASEGLLGKVSPASQS
jgi:hypothetical protein